MTSNTAASSRGSGADVDAGGIRLRTVRSRSATVVLAVLPTAAIVLAAVLGGSRPVPLVIVAVGVLAVVFVLLRANTVAIVGSILLWLSIERFAVASLSPLLEPDGLRAVLAYKEAFFPLLAVVGVPAVANRWREATTTLRAVDALAVGFCVLVAAAFLASPAALDDRLLYARRLALLPAVYLSVRLLPWNPTSLVALVRSVVVVGTALACFGFVERFIAESLIWREAVPAAYYYHLSDLAGLSANATDFPVNGLPVTFFDFTSGVATRRLVSTFLESTTLASFLAFAAIVAIAIPRARALRAVAVVVGVACLLTLSKAGIGILVGGFGYLIATWRVPRLRDPAWLVSIAATLVGGLLVVALALEAANAPTGALAHFQGLKEGVESALLHPLGLGLGVGGDFSATHTGGESTFGVLLAQLGVPGLLLWGVWAIALAIACASRDGVLNTGRIGAALGVALMGFLATASLTESAGGLLGNWIYAAAAGAFLTACAVPTGRLAPRDPPEARRGS